MLPEATSLHSVQNLIVILLLFYRSFIITSALDIVRGLSSIVKINKLRKTIYSKDLNCSMSPSFIVLILFEAKISTIFTEVHVFQILEIASMFYKCPPVIVIEPSTTEKVKVQKMVPVVEADELLHIHFL
jgi:hypothetical protein